LEVSVLAFGAWQLGDPDYWGADADADGDAAVRAAIDAGINLFDTAEGYGGGASERALGRTLGTDRGQVLIASKVSASHGAPGQIRAACESSLRNLETDWIDLYQVHWPFRNMPFEDAYAEMAGLQQEGKIREIGLSNFGREDLQSWMHAGACVSNQLGYNLVFRAIEHEIVPACRAHGVGILAYMPLLQGLLANRWPSAGEVPPSRRRTRHFSCKRAGVRHGEPGCEDLLFQSLARVRCVAQGLGQPTASVALAWLMAQPGVTSVIIGARNPAQLARNTAAADLQLDAAVLRELDAATQALKDHFGANADMWQSGAASRIR